MIRILGGPGRPLPQVFPLDQALARTQWAEGSREAARFNFTVTGMWSQNAQHRRSAGTQQAYRARGWLPGQVMRTGPNRQAVTKNVQLGSALCEVFPRDLKEVQKELLAVDLSVSVLIQNHKDKFLWSPQEILG